MGKAYLSGKSSCTKAVFPDWRGPTSKTERNSEATNNHIPSRNSGLRHMDLLSMCNKASPALNFCFFWFKPKEDATPAKRRR